MEKFLERDKKISHGYVRAREIGSCMVSTEQTSASIIITTRLCLMGRAFIHPV